MLQNITWSDYFLFIGLLLAGYYALYMLKYKKPRLNAGSVGRNGPYNQYQPSEHGNAPGEPDLDAIPDELFDQAQELMTRLKAAIRLANNNELDKEQLLANLKKELNDYPSLNIEAFRPGINRFVTVECDNTSSVTLSEREVDGLWSN